MDHLAGLAKLSIAGLTDQAVQWTVTDEKGLTTSSSAAQFVLKPGHYVASAIFDKHNLKSDFIIAAGETQEIELSK